MKRQIIILSLAIIGCTLKCQAGAIVGTVRAEGKPEASADALCGKYDSRQFKFVERVNYAEMHDFVVYIVGKLPGQAVPTNQTAVVETRRRVTQKGAMFTPHVLPVTVGTTVEWPNNDDILHNVFSMSEVKNFDLGLYKSPAKSVLFDTPGRVDVFCSIHSRMNCIVLVLENPYFAAANEKGSYRITNVPPGKYQLRAWHERMPSQTREIVVPDTGDLKMDFLLGIKNLPTL